MASDLFSREPRIITKGISRIQKVVVTCAITKLGCDDKVDVVKKKKCMIIYWNLINLNN